MDIRFSRHARKQMKWRKISEEEVMAAIDNPDKLEDTIKNRKNAFKTINDRQLKITYKPEERDIIVVTAILKGE